MRTLILTIFILILPFQVEKTFSQTVQFPSNITLSNLVGLNNNVTKVSTFPIYIDNQHKIGPIKNKRLWSAELAGINLQNKVPLVCLDDFRYGHKFDNTIGANGIGSLSLAYWLPSNGNYLLFYFTLENGMDYYREFLVTTTLSGAYIGHLLVCDGWSDSPSHINFTQAKINADLSISLYEIRNLNANYIPITTLTTFTGKKAVAQYSINTDGVFVLNSTTLSNQRTFNITELKGLISNITAP